MITWALFRDIEGAALCLRLRFSKSREKVGASRRGDARGAVTLRLGTADSTDYGVP